ncbi:MAG: right-handed parallel beta-helix repeat-containing protein [Elusimicrobiales bacterium]|nr:right-handed parallel beta-helix repeat-containing protein [Elusimicrobiales bacterium]
MRPFLEKLYPVLGHSMRFLLEPGDAVAARPCAPAALRAGDIALLVRWSGGLPSGYVLHRVVLNLSFAGGPVLTRGDANLLPDWPPSSYQPAGAAAALLRGGRRYELARGLWPSLLLPLYSLAANKLLFAAAAAAAGLFSLACRLRPAFAAPQLNSLYLAWETRLYPALLRLLAAPALPRGGAPAPAAAAVRSGRVTSDETWGGRMAVADYLTIEAGVTVTVLPGTQLVFERREPWFFPVLRAGGGGEKLELESAGAKLLVYGRLLAAGTPAEPILFGGPAFSGVHALGDGRVDLRHCRLSGSASCALSVRDSAEGLAAACSLDACARGVELYGGANAAFTGCSVAACGGSAFLVSGHATLLAHGGSAGCRGAAAEISGSAAAGFYGFTAAGCGAGFSVSGRAAVRLERCSVSGAGGRALSCSDRSSLTAVGSSFTANPAGVRAEGATSTRFESSAFSSAAGPCAQFYGRNESVFTGCSFSGGKGPALQAYGYNRLSLDRCAVSGGETAAAFFGRGELRAAHSVFAGSSGAAFKLDRAARFSAEACRFEDCKAGVRAEDCLELVLQGCLFSANAGPAAVVSGRSAVLVSGSVFSGNGLGLHFAGDTAACVAACRFEGQRGAPLLLDGRARSVLEKSAFTGNSSGVALAGRAEVEAADCSFSGNGGPSFELCGNAVLDARACVSSGEPAALLLREGGSGSLARCSSESFSGPAASLEGTAGLRAAGSSFKSARDAVYCRGASTLDLSGCSLSGGTGAALDFAGAEARLRSVTASGTGGLLAAGPGLMRAEGLTIRASAYAVDSSGARLLLSGLAAEGGARGGLLLTGGSARVENSAFSGAPYPGLAAGGGARLLCRAVTFDGTPWRPQPVPPAPARLRPALAAFAAATAHLPLFRALYREFYLAGVRAAGFLLKPGSGSSVYLYRGMAAPGWVAGLSDMDLALLQPRLTPAADWAAFSALRSRLRVFRALFPFTGEVLSAPAEDFSGFVSGWGLKGAEFRAASRLLAGPPLPAPPEREGRAADATEAFYSYTLLLSHFLAAGLPPAFRARNCLKGLADVKRYLDRGSPLRASRADYAAAHRLAPGAGAPSPEDAAFLAFSALHAASPAAGPALAARSAAPGWFNRHAFEAACERLRGSAGGEAGVALDSLYRVYLVLPDAVAGDKSAFLRAAAALRGGGSYFAAAPLVLTRASFAFLARLPYLNNPLFCLDLAAAPGGRSPEDGGVFTWNLELPAPPAAPAAAEGAALAARHFGASWRSLWGAMPPHYFYTRAAGLRLLLETGECPPFSGPAALGERLRAAYSGEPAWSEFAAGGACRANYEFVAAHARAALEAAGGR